MKWLPNRRQESVRTFLPDIVSPCVSYPDGKGSEHMLYCSGTCMLEPFGEEHEQREHDHCYRSR